MQEELMSLHQGFRTMPKQVFRFQLSPAYSIRSKLVFGVNLCALARAENRMGSPIHAVQLLVKAKRVVENVSRTLHQETRFSASDRYQLEKLNEYLKDSIRGLDPLWIPGDEDVPLTNDSAAIAA